MSITETISVKNLSKSYGKKQAVKALSFTVNAGSVFGLLGANGAGKSTSIECILGTRKPDQGEITVLGLDPRTNRKQLFENVGVQFQEANYQTEIKVNELCEETASLYKHPQNYHELLRRFGIEKMETRCIKDLSGGERQRLFIILALIPDPKVVFLDELTTGLDARARRSVWMILKHLKEIGLTIFLTSHFMDEVEVLCDQICILNKGEVAFLGTVKEAIEKSPYEHFEDAYLWYSDDHKEDDEIEFDINQIRKVKKEA